MHVLLALTCARAVGLQEDSRSVGISVSLWTLPDHFELAYKILDLAGQAVYASTNQFFLTPRAV